MPPFFAPSGGGASSSLKKAVIDCFNVASGIGAAFVQFNSVQYSEIASLPVGTNFGGSDLIPDIPSDTALRKLFTFSCLAASTSVAMTSILANVTALGGAFVTGSVSVNSTFTAFLSMSGVYAPFNSSRINIDTSIAGANRSTSLGTLILYTAEP